MSDDLGGRQLARLLRLLGWNVLLLGGGVLLVVAAAEVWLRTTSPFMSSTSAPRVFVPGVGFMWLPHTEFAHTNGLDFWQRSRTNSLGFLDREPIPRERAAASCHIAMIGDSFVAAKQVPIGEKFHVRLEKLAARQLPVLDITTSAFGMPFTGQVNQLPFYDEYARSLKPKMVVLVFVGDNDYFDNSRIVHMLRFSTADCRWACATRAVNGALRLRPPSPTARSSPSTVETHLGFSSYFVQWLHAKFRSNRRPRSLPFLADVEQAVQRPQGVDADYYAGLLPHLMAYAGSRRGLGGHWGAGPESLIYRDAIATTAFALDEFKKRATRDGVQLAILRAQARRGRPLSRMATERRIPIIHLADYVRRQGGHMRDAHWPHDYHWNPTGHQWAAEALLEYLQRNQHVCKRRPGSRPTSGGSPKPDGAGTA